MLINDIIHNSCGLLMDKYLIRIGLLSIVINLSTIRYKSPRVRQET